MPVSLGAHDRLEAGVREAARFPALLVEASRVAATIAQGVHGRRRVGIGETFWQYRNYEYLDPVGRVDWRQSAKGARLYVRETEWEAAQTVYLWRDASASMAWASRRRLTDKKDRAELLLLALAILLNGAGERIALLDRDMPPLSGRGGLIRLAEALEKDDQGGDLPRPLAGRGREVPRDADVVLFSDFLQPIEAIQRAIAGLSARRIKGFLVQVLDPAEAALPFRGRIQFTGLEGEGPALMPNVDSVRSAYLARLAERQDALREMTRRAGWRFLVHHTDAPPHTALLGLHQALTGG